MAEEQKRNDSTKTPEMVTRGHYRDISASCVESSSAGVSLMVDGREEIEKFYSGHLFSLSHSFQPFCFIFLCIRVKHEKDVCV